jgi:hypothetical protein
LFPYIPFEFCERGFEGGRRKRRRTKRRKRRRGIKTFISLDDIYYTRML